MNATKILAAMLIVVSTLAVPAFVGAGLFERTKAEQIERKRAASEQIAQARARFWETYPDKPGADEAQRRFEELLREKDAFYLQAALFGDLALEVDMDGGIREYAKPEFNDWVKAARDNGAASPMPGQLMDAVTAALTINAWEYKAYVRARNWSEFDAVHRLPPGFDKPETYGGYLYFRYKFARLPKDDPRAKSPGQNAAATFDKMVEVLGKQLVYDAVKKVMDAPKSDKGNLPITVPRPVKKGPLGAEVDDDDVPMPDGVIGVYASPLTALQMLVIKDDDRRYLLWLLSGQKPSQTNPTGTDPTTEWAFAEGLYHRLVLAFGEKDVMQAAHLIRTAKKRMTDYRVMDPKAIGATRTIPWTSFEDILARKNPAGYVRATLMFQRSAQLKTPAEVDAAYKQLLATNGEKAVLEAAGKLAAERPNLIYLDELARLKEVLDGSLTFAKPPAPETLVDFPEYLAWRNFAPGAKVVQATRYWQLAGPNNFVAGPVNYLRTFQLQYVNAEKIKLWSGETFFDRSGRPKPPSEREEAYPAKFAPPPNALVNQSRQAQLLTIFAGASNIAMGAQPSAVPIESGEETIEVNGKRIATRWESASYQYDASVWTGEKNCRLVVKLWTSDAVPTGLVRKTEEKTCSPVGVGQVPRFMVETYLQSFEGFTPAVADASKPGPAK